MKTKVLIVLFFFLDFYSSAQTDTIVKYFNYAWKETTPSLASYYSVAFKQDTIWRKLDFYAVNDQLKKMAISKMKNLKNKLAP